MSRRVSSFRAVLRHLRGLFPRLVSSRLSLASPAVMGWIGEPRDRGRQPAHAAGAGRHGPRVRRAARHPGTGPDRVRVRGALHPHLPRRPSARPRTATCSGAGWSGPCSCCGRPTAASPTSVWTPGSPAWARSAGPSPTSWASRRAAYREPRAAAAGAVLLRHGLDPAVAPPEPPELSSFGEAPGSGRLASVSDMINTLGITQIFVLDQDQALDFYVGKLGLEVGTDVDLGFMRWLTVRVPGEDREILLERPGPPRLRPGHRRRRARDGDQGRVRRHLVLQHRRRVRHPRRAEGEGRRARRGTDDQQSYGIDFGFRDPFGNHIRIAQRPTSEEQS